jgi:hypothetical protein
MGDAGMQVCCVVRRDLNEQQVPWRGAACTSNVKGLRSLRKSFRWVQAEEAYEGRSDAASDV